MEHVRAESNSFPFMVQFPQLFYLPFLRLIFLVITRTLKLRGRGLELASLVDRGSELLDGSSEEFFLLIVNLADREDLLDTASLSESAKKRTSLNITGSLMVA